MEQEIQYGIQGLHFKKYLTKQERKLFVKRLGRHKRKYLAANHYNLYRFIMNSPFMDSEMERAEYLLWQQIAWRTAPATEIISRVVAYDLRDGMAHEIKEPIIDEIKTSILNNVELLISKIK